MASITPLRIKLSASAARDVLALLFTPMVTILAVWVICIIAYGEWSTNVETVRIHYLGALCVVLVSLVGMGGQWFQRNRVSALKVTAFGAAVDLANSADEGKENGASN
jgi:hypothetical protein